MHVQQEKARSARRNAPFLGTHPSNHGKRSKNCSGAHFGCLQAGPLNRGQLDPNLDIRRHHHPPQNTHLTVPASPMASPSPSPQPITRDMGDTLSTSASVLHPDGPKYQHSVRMRPPWATVLWKEPNTSPLVLGIGKAAPPRASVSN